MTKRATIRITDNRQTKGEKGEPMQPSWILHRPMILDVRHMLCKQTGSSRRSISRLSLPSCVRRRSCCPFAHGLSSSVRWGRDRKADSRASIRLHH